MDFSSQLRSLIHLIIQLIIEINSARTCKIITKNVQFLLKGPLHLNGWDLACDVKGY